MKNARVCVCAKRVRKTVVLWSTWKKCSVKGVALFCLMGWRKIETWCKNNRFVLRNAFVLRRTAGSQWLESVRTRAPQPWNHGFPFRGAAGCTGLEPMVPNLGTMGSHPRDLWINSCGLQVVPGQSGGGSFKFETLIAYRLEQRLCL